MARFERNGPTKPSASRKMQRRSRGAASRPYPESVPALIEKRSVELGKWEALDRLLRDAPPVDDATYATFLDEMAGSRK